MGHVVRAVDCFLIEGEKFLFRLALALALHFERTRHEVSCRTLSSDPKLISDPKSPSLERMRLFCQSLDLSPQELVQNACRLTRLSRKHIDDARLKAHKREPHVLSGHVEAWRAPDAEWSAELGARLAPRRFRSTWLTWAELDQLWEWLPERVVVREPEVVFSTAEHGRSLQTFFGLAQHLEPTVLLVRTPQDHVLGAFCSSAWSGRQEHAHFGTGETFLFALRPERTRFEWVGRRGQPVAHAQQLFQSASGGGLCVGSGGGRFGLFVDQSLTRGRSERCDTFDNAPLARGER